jgi:hypothetical protein
VNYCGYLSFAESRLTDYKKSAPPKGFIQRTHWR